MQCVALRVVSSNEGIRLQDQGRDLAKLAGRRHPRNSQMFSAGMT